MPCIPITIGGVTAIVCTRDKPKCSVPGCLNRHTQLCDYPVLRKGEKETCDAKLCDQHAVSGGPDLCYCPPHARMMADAKRKVG